MNAPLKGVRVLDLSRLIPGPFCTLILSDLGASVDKLEDPHVGDYRAGITFTRYYWQLELDADLRPTGRDIVTPPGPPPPH